MSAPTSPSYDRLFLIPDCHSYIVAISSAANQLAVFCTTTSHSCSDQQSEAKAVRTLQNIISPQNVCMVNKFKALVLCGDRQLKLYDLDSGKLVIKLKGVMNQKMPYFAVIDEKNCIALSRNRMTANIMSLETGDLTTTFKVGEDRFLNSLLVSQNGNICVCGDETQKPFPLLVWDLNARKLLYDLRLQHHNFLTQHSGISEDAHYVVSIAEEVNSQAPNFIVVYDLTTGMLFKKWKPPNNTTAICIKGKVVVNACTDGSIFIWDLSTGDKRHTLSGHTSAVDSLTIADSGPEPLLLSYDSTATDAVIRVWDLEKGQVVKEFSPSQPVTCCRLSADGSHLIFSTRGSLKVHSLRLGNSAAAATSCETEVYGQSQNESKTFQLEN